MSSRIGNEKWVFTFSFNMVTMLKVYRMVLKHKIWGSFLKQALKNGLKREALGTMRKLNSDFVSCTAAATVKILMKIQ